MTKEEMFKEMEKMAPVLGRNGVDIVLGRRIPGSFTRGYFFNEEAGLWEVYSCGERNEYFVRKQTGSEQEAVEKLYRMAKYEYESLLEYMERERQRKRECRTGRDEPFGAKQKGKRARFPFLFSPRDESEVEWMRMTKHAGDLVPHRRKDRKSE